MPRRRTALLALAAAPFVYPSLADASIQWNRLAMSTLPPEESRIGTDWMNGEFESEGNIQTIVSAALGNIAKPTLWLMVAEPQVTLAPVNAPNEPFVREWDSIVLFSDRDLGQKSPICSDLIWPATGL